MKTSAKNSVQKNSVVINKVNLIVDAEKNTKELKKIDTITEKEKEKNQKELIKQARKNKNESKKTISDAWKLATKSKSAIKKYISENSELIQPYLDNINTIYNTNFDINVFNGTLENFAITSDDYKVDIDGNEINEKDDFRNVNWYLTLLERKAKYKDYTCTEFLEYDKKRLTAKCKSMLNSEVLKIDTTAKIELNKNEYKKFSKEFKLIETNLHKENENVLNSEILEAYNNLLDKYLINTIGFKVKFIG